MAAGKAGNGYSVIKGYDLLGYHENPVPIEPGELKKFVYFLTQDMEIKATDNIRVNLLYGLESSVIDGKIDGNMTVKFDSIEFDYESKTEDADALQETLVEDTLKQEELEILDTPLDGGIAKVETELPLDGGIVEPLLEVPLDGCLDEAICTEKELKGSGFPVEATCFCCGKRKLLKWVFENQHVCDECKEFLKEKYDAKEELKLDLDATQLEILHLLRRDNKLSLDGMSEKLGKNKSTVKRKLKLLLENKQVRREKIGKEYIYYPNE
jgi:hypothetical protein